MKKTVIKKIIVVLFLILVIYFIAVFAEFFTLRNHLDNKWHSSKVQKVNIDTTFKP